MKYKSIYNYKFLLKKSCLSKHILFILFLKDETDTDLLFVIY